MSKLNYINGFKSLLNVSKDRSSTQTIEESWSATFQQPVYLNIWASSGRVKIGGKHDSVKGFYPFCTHFTAAGTMNISHETQSHTTAFYTKHR